MGFFSEFKNLISNSRYRRSYARMLNGQTPVFNSFGKNIYAYDILRNAIAVNCMEISMLEPRHIRYDREKETQVNVNGDINRLLSAAPNPYMTPSDFLYKCNWLYETTDNCYIYPTFEKEYVKKGYYKRKYTGFYPLDPGNVEFVQDERTDKIYVRMEFDGGYVIELPYSDIIHWKKNVTSYDIAGGYEENRADKSLMNLLNADNTAVQGIDKAVKSKLTINGILKINTYSSNDVQEKVIADFEEKIKRGQNGIIPLDVKSDYIPITISADEYVTISAVCTDTSLSLYRNGIFVDTLGAANSSQKLNIARISFMYGLTSYDRDLNGSLKSLRIYNRKLTDSEILHNSKADKLMYF